MKYAESVIDDYDASSGATRRATAAVNGMQANDPKKLAQAVVTIAHADEPPFRFTAGADAVEVLEQSFAAKKKEFDQWRTLSVSMAHN